MASLPFILEVLILIAKVVPIIVGTIGAFLFLSPERLPHAISSRRYLYWPTLATIYVVAAVALFSAVDIIAGFSFDTGEKRSSSTLVPRPTILAPINVPPLAEFPTEPLPFDKAAGFTVADVSLGSPMEEAVRIITDRDQTCSEIDITHRASGDPDPVFQKPRAVKCYRDSENFEHILLFPDIYESGERVFAIARLSWLSELRISDIRELLVATYGPASQEDYPPQIGKKLFWRKQKPPRDDDDLGNRDKNCFIDLPNSLAGSSGLPFFSRGRIPNIVLSSHGLNGNCGIVLTAFLNKNLGTYLFLVDTGRLLKYKAHGEKIAAMKEVETINRAREKIKF